MIKIIKIKAKKAFSPSKIPGADFVINQYIGCEHACLYCYAKFMCRWYKHGRWGSWVVVKENMPELVKRQKVSGRVYMSSVSDAYQPIEKELKLTRKVLENMDKSTKLAILTKSNLVLRDIDLFKQFKDIEVGLTINSFEGSLKNSIEPLSSKNEDRIQALKVLHENGVKNYAFISPIIYGLTDVELFIRETKGFVDSYWFEFLNLQASGKEFKDWLKDNYPESYDIMTDKQKSKSFVEKIIAIIKKEHIKVNGVATHYPKLKVM